MSTNLAMMAAMAENRVIGSDGDLPWHLPNDLKRFKNTTRGHLVIMGRKTFESLGNKPLPNRTNIVITTKENYQPQGVTVVHSFKEAMQVAESSGDTEPFIIGGGTIYEEALPYAKRIYLTLVHTKVKGDTYFPEFQTNDWKITYREEFQADERHNFPYSFLTFEKKEKE